MGITLNALYSHLEYRAAAVSRDTRLALLGIVSGMRNIANDLHLMDLSTSVAHQ